MGVKLPDVQVIPASLPLAGGLDTISSPMLAAPGTASFVQNYECVFGGGYQRVGGIERYDGRASPSAATYTLVPFDGDETDLPVGASVTSSSGGAGTIIGRYIDDSPATTGTLVLAGVTGTFDEGDDIEVSSVAVAVVTTGDEGVTAAENNAFVSAAADIQRALIEAVPGEGQIRGFAVLNDVRYAWRDSGSAMRIYEATSTGWEQVALGEYVTFSNANVAAGVGTTLTQGGTTATIARMVLESGTYASGTNTGKIIITGRSGNFSAGAATTDGSGTLTLGGAQVAITLLAGGRVQTDTWNFTASLSTRRLYGCDGVNPEFEFDGTVYVPLNIAIATRATAVRCHKNHALFGFRGSLQTSGIADPYKYTVVSGAAELGTGDVITGLVPVAGSEAGAALLVLCEQSSWALFGNDSSDWQLTPLSRDAGATAYSAQDAGLVIAHDTPGFRSYNPTDRFGNFAWNLESRLIESLVQNKTPVASCFSKAYSRYRVFFSDGTVISGTPGKKGWQWSTLDYGRTIVIAWSGEVAGVTKTYYGDDDGFIYEADVGRSFDGDEVVAVLKLHGLNQGKPMVDKTYRWGVIESFGESAFTLSCSADFDDGLLDKAESELFAAALSGGGAVWDVANWDQAFWDAQRLGSLRFGLNGRGYNVAPIFVSQADDELPHQIKTLTIFYTPRRVRRG